MRKQLDPLVYFVDIDLGRNFYQQIEQDSRFRVEFHDHHFPEGTDDSVWIPYISERGWVGVTHDKKIKRHHRTIIGAAKARLIIVVGTHLLEKQAANFCASYSKVERFVLKNPAPYTAKLYQPSPKDAVKKLNPVGRIEMWGNW